MGLHFKEILLCDDHPICRIGIETALRSILLPPLRIHHASDAETALQKAKKTYPDLAIVDLQLPDMTGMDLIRALRMLSPQIKTLVVTGCENPAILKQIARQQVHGLLQKSFTLDRFSEALAHLSASKSEIYLDPQLEIIFQENPTPTLTQREREVLELISKGLTTKEIAALLKCSAETVKTHRSNIMFKTQSRNSAEVIAWYLEGNLKTHFRAAP